MSKPAHETVTLRGTDCVTVRQVEVAQLGDTSSDQQNWLQRGGHQCKGEVRIHRHNLPYAVKMCT